MISTRKSKLKELPTESRPFSNLICVDCLKAKWAIVESGGGSISAKCYCPEFLKYTFEGIPRHTSTVIFCEAFGEAKED